jgi:hypothetical protein
MYVTTHSALTWKRLADENESAARRLAKVSVALAAMILLTGAYAFATHQRNDSLCSIYGTGPETAPTSAPDPDHINPSAYCG